MTAAEQFVPQICAIQSAFQLASQRQGMSDSELLKSIGEPVELPLGSPAHQLEAGSGQDGHRPVPRHFINWPRTPGRQATSSPSLTSGACPDPRNADYETPVSDLEAMYNQLAKEYPGQAPADTATPLPSVHL